MRGGSRWRRRGADAVIVAALAVSVVGCTVGPAANRAADVSSDDTNSGSPGDDNTDLWRPPDDSSSPSASSSTSEPPEQADEHGSAEVDDTLTEGIDGITNACCMAELPSGDLFIGDQDTGKVVRVSQSGEITDVGVVRGVTLGADHSLLGLAVEPDSSGDVDELYVYYARSSDARVASYSYDEEASEGEQLGTYADALVNDIPYSTTHNGGALAFGPDGMLYAGTGDTGDPALAEDADSYAGKILRIDPDTGYPPDDNPDQDSYVYSSGHTDVEGLAWDGADRLWAVDGTELNAIAPGGDYANQQDPVYDWSSSGSGSGSGSTVEPTGLAYDEGSRSLWMTSQTDSGIWRIPLNGQDGLVEGAEPELLADSDSSSDSNGQLSDARDLLPGDASGELLALTASASGGGAVLRVTVT